MKKPPAAVKKTTAASKPVEPGVILSPIRAGYPEAGGTLEVLVRVQAPAQAVPEGSAVNCKAKVESHNGSATVRFLEWRDPIRQG